jgi:hypothetical protein
VHAVSTCLARIEHHRGLAIWNVGHAMPSATRLHSLSLRWFRLARLPNLSVLAVGKVLAYQRYSRWQQLLNAKGELVEKELRPNEH